MNQLPLFEIHRNELVDTPAARTTDPQTSHDAAEDIDVNEVINRCLIVLRGAGEPLTAREVAWRCINAWPGDYEQDTYRKRVQSEMKPLLRECEARVCSRSGRKATTYEVKE